jgi:polo-like kinase 1
VIFEEKISMVNGEVAIKKYARGKALGKLGKGGVGKYYEITNLETKQLFTAKIIDKNTLNKNRARLRVLSCISII